MGYIIQNATRERRPKDLLSSGCLRANAARQIYWDPKQARGGLRRGKCMEMHASRASTGLDVPVFLHY